MGPNLYWKHRNILNLLWKSYFHHMWTQKCRIFQFYALTNTRGECMYPYCVNFPFIPYPEVSVRRSIEYSGEKWPSTGVAAAAARNSKLKHVTIGTEHTHTHAIWWKRRRYLVDDTKCRGLPNLLTCSYHSARDIPISLTKTPVRNSSKYNNNRISMKQHGNIARLVSLTATPVTITLSMPTTGHGHFFFHSGLDAGLCASSWIPSGFIRILYSNIGIPSTAPILIGCINWLNGIAWTVRLNVRRLFCTMHTQCMYVRNVLPMRAFGIFTHHPAAQDIYSYFNMIYFFSSFSLVFFNFRSKFSLALSGRRAHVVDCEAVFSPLPRTFAIRQSHSHFFFLKLEGVFVRIYHCHRLIVFSANTWS